MRQQVQGLTNDGFDEPARYAINAPTEQDTHVPTWLERLVTSNDAGDDSPRRRRNRSVAEIDKLEAVPAGVTERQVASLVSGCSNPRRAAGGRFECAARRQPEQPPFFPPADSDAHGTRMRAAMIRFQGAADPALPRACRITACTQHPHIVGGQRSGDRATGPDSGHRIGMWTAGGGNIQATGDRDGTVGETSVAPCHHGERDRGRHSVPPVVSGKGPQHLRREVVHRAARAPELSEPRPSRIGDEDSDPIGHTGRDRNDLGDHVPQLGRDHQPGIAAPDRGSDVDR